MEDQVYEAEWTQRPARKRTRQHEHLSPEQEREVALAIRAEVQLAREALEGVAAAEAVLKRRGSRSERTSAAAMERLEEAANAVSADSADAARGREARQHLARAQELRWKLALSSAHVARAESSRFASSLMSAEDLLQDGYIGLLDAAVRFNPDLGIRFTTYARWWVRARMTRSIERGGRTIRLSGGAYEQLRILRNVSEVLTANDQRVTEERLAEETGLDIERIRWLLSYSTPMSLDEPDENGISLEERISSDGTATDEIAGTQEALGRLGQLLDEVLEPREQQVLKDRLGLGGQEARTFAAIGAEMGVSRERVRQIHEKAVNRLRAGLYGAYMSPSFSNR